MENVPPEEQYETDTIFSQDGDLPDSYFHNKLKEIDSDCEDFVCGDELNLPKTKNYQSNETFKLGSVEEKMIKGSFVVVDDAEFILQDENIGYNIEKDTFRYGRVTKKISYNLTTGMMQENIKSQVKKLDEDNDKSFDNNISHPKLYTSELILPKKSNVSTQKITNESSTETEFLKLYNEQMPKCFEYGTSFPEIKKIWALFFEEKSYKDMSTFEIQASVCAALNSKSYMIYCIGIDKYNNVTGVELSPEDRVTFRMALSRAIAGEFQPPLVDIPSKHITEISPLKRDVANFTSMIDVIFVPVLGSSNSCGLEEDKENSSRRFLIVVRVKEITDKLYQLSSGRVYVEENGKVMKLSCLDEAFKLLVIKDENTPPGSVFITKPEEVMDMTEFDYVFVEAENEKMVESSDEEQINDEIKIKPEKVENKFITTINVKSSSIWKKIVKNVNKNTAEAVGWTLLGFATSYGVFKIIKKLK